MGLILCRFLADRILNGRWLETIFVSILVAVAAATAAGTPTLTRAVDEIEIRQTSYISSERRPIAC